MGLFLDAVYCGSLAGASGPDGVVAGLGSSSARRFAVSLRQACMVKALSLDFHRYFQCWNKDWPGEPCWAYPEQWPICLRQQSLAFCCCQACWYSSPSWVGTIGWRRGFSNHPEISLSAIAIISQVLVQTTQHEHSRTCNKDIWLFSSAWAWRVAATFLSNASTVGFKKFQNEKNMRIILTRSCDEFSHRVYLDHAHKAVCQSIASWIASKILGFILQAGCWKHYLDWIWEHQTLIVLFWKAVTWLHLCQIYTCRVAIFFSSHPVASCDSETAVFGSIWFGFTNDQPKLVLLLLLYSGQCYN